MYFRLASAGEHLERTKSMARLVTSTGMTVFKRLLYDSIPQPKLRFS